ncbi:MAG: DUF3301 domain-containing protein [Gammaproteobacteria bacterium]|nr:DUF3301 domain-containing protein [Gammaproteobacteria bacterium]
MTGIILLVILAGIAWFWFDSLRARELALRTGARACAGINVQFLDQSVSVEQLRLGRDAGGQLVFRRLFSFDFSGNGADRRRGRIVILGRSVQSVTLESADGSALITGESSR